MSWATSVRWFSPSVDVALHDPDGTRLSRELMMLLDRARGDFGAPFVVTSGWRDPSRNAAAGGATNSAHMTGEAVDGYFDGTPLRLAFVHVARYHGFGGIGLYPHTTPPTLHVDVRTRTPRLTAVWIRDAYGVYLYAPTPAFYAALEALP